MKVILENISKNIKDKKILDNINFQVQEKEFVMLIGKNGSGKSSLINIVSRFDKEFDGVIKYDFSKKEIILSRKKIRKKDLRLLRERVKVLFQISDVQLFKTTIIDEIKFGLKNIGLKGEKLKKEAEELFTSLGFDETYRYKSPFQLSEGEKRKLLIVCVVSLFPDLLILDEPTSNLDKESKIDLINFLLKIKNEKNISTILVTHDHSILKYSDRVLVLKDGELIFDGNEKDIDNTLLKEAELMFDE